MAKVLMPLAAGFEEVEAVTIVDVLRRGDVEVVIAGLVGKGPVTGAHDIVVHADHGLDEVQDERFDMLVLPGGEPGTTNLAASNIVRSLIRRYASEERPVAAICAAPRILAADGLLSGRRATSHPTVEAQLRTHGVRYDERSRVVRDAAFITSRGPGTALDFALELLELLDHRQQASALRTAMLVAPA